MNIARLWTNLKPINKKASDSQCLRRLRESTACKVKQAIVRNIDVMSKSQRKWEECRHFKPVEQVRFTQAKGTMLRTYNDPSIIPEKRNDPETGTYATCYVCDYPRDKCCNCRDIFSGICRFNSTSSFWKASPEVMELNL